jgi:hypothetical protein
VDGEWPAVGRRAATERLRASGMKQRWTPMGGKVAQSADLGFTYGKGTYARAGGTPADGELTYLNVWQKRGADWKLLLRVVNPVRPPAKAQR